MVDLPHLSRRSVLTTGLLGAGSLLLPGCDRLNSAPGFRRVLIGSQGLTMAAQRALMGDGLAREFAETAMSPPFRANGSLTGDDPAWRAAAATGFSGWNLLVDGLVQTALALPLSALQAMPQRRQITRHDCVEGWSAIGQWQGPQLGPILAKAGLLPTARYVVFHCADRLSGKPYYESIDLIDAFHPQTILAWQMNGQPLPIQHGAPLRLRVERQLGYKQAKYVMRIELRASLAGLYGGKGGYWEDGHDYAWYAGI